MTGSGGASEAAEGGQWIDSTAAWGAFEANLVAYLAEAGQRDHLMVVLPVAGLEQGAPHVSFGVLPSGRRYLCVPADEHLDEFHRSGDQGARFMAQAGFGEPGEAGWVHEASVGGADGSAQVASMALVVLRELFDVPHPGLLAYDAVGPAPAERLGVPLHSEVVSEGEAAGLVAGALDDQPVQVLLPQSHEELLSMVVQVLTERCGKEPEADDEGDLIVTQNGQVAWVRARVDQPAIEVLTPVVDGVDSRRQAAVEIAILNREQAWVKWQLKGRRVLLGQMIAAYPFIPGVLNQMLDLFFAALEESTADLALRTRGTIL